MSMIPTSSILFQEKKIKVAVPEPTPPALVTRLSTDFAPSPVRKKQLASLTPSEKADYIPPKRNVDFVDDGDDDDRLYCICK